MNTYVHNVQYYETDKMGITHHSNYVRWMEEARADFLRQIGYGLKRLEQDGVTSPVVSIECHYLTTTTFDDKIEVSVKLLHYTGVKLTLGYTMKNCETQTTVFTATSSHCFINEHGHPIAVKKHYPGFDAILRECVEPA